MVSTQDQGSAKDPTAIAGQVICINVSSLEIDEMFIQVLSPSR